MTLKEIRRAVRAIGLALNLSHNCVVTDDPGAEPDQHSWRTNHTEELKMLKELEEFFIGKVDG